MGRPKGGERGRGGKGEERGSGPTEGFWEGERAEGRRKGVWRFDAEGWRKRLRV